MVPICNFKSNKLSLIDKKQRAEEALLIKTGKDEPGSPTRFDVIRLPNKTTKQTKEIGD
jgi:hypothetical protein